MTKISKSLLVAIAALGLKACNSSSSDEDGSLKIAAETPEDSTGSTGNVRLSFGAVSGAALTDAVSFDEVTIDSALLNIAKIKIKASKDMTDDEQELEDVENAEEAADSAAVEDEGSALKPNGEQSNEEKRQEREDRIAEKKAEHEAREAQRLEEQSARDGSTRWVGPFVFDAVTGALESDLPAVEIPDGSYHRIEFQLKRSYDERLIGNVMMVRGAVMIDDVSVPFALDWHVAVNFRLSGSSAFKVEAGEDNAMLVSLDLSAWFDGVDWAAAEVDDDGTIYIDKHSNKTIMKKIHRNMKIGARFGKDADDDGILGADEGAGQGQVTTDAEAS